MSNCKEHGEDCHEFTVQKRGRMLMQLAIDMACDGERCTRSIPTNVELGAALQYLVAAITHIAVEDEEPRQVLEAIIHSMDSFPIEKIAELVREDRQ